MASRLDYECPNGHRFEKFSGRDFEKCPECGRKSEILWLSPQSPHRQLQTPIVMWRYSDGSLGVAGGADSKTPKNAERIEIRSLGEYRRYTKELNSQIKSKDSRREERFLEAKEHLERQRRSNLSWMMGQEDDPAARDLYKAAMEWRSDKGPAQSFREFFSTVMEMNRSNYE